MGYLVDVKVNEDGSVTKQKLGGTLEDASAVKMASGNTVQKDITDLQARDINTFGTSDRWNGGSYTKGQYTIYQDTLYECLVNNSNVVPTNTTYWKKVSLAELSNEMVGLLNEFNLDKTLTISGTRNSRNWVFSRAKYVATKDCLVYVKGIFQVKAKSNNVGGIIIGKEQAQSFFSTIDNCRLSATEIRYLKAGETINIGYLIPNAGDSYTIFVYSNVQFIEVAE